MNQNNYTALKTEQYSYLNKIDFKPYIDKYKDLDDLWDAIEDDYDHTELTINDFLKGYIFNYMSRHKLKLYIKERYNINYEEIETVKYIRP